MAATCAHAPSKSQRRRPPQRGPHLVTPLQQFLDRNRLPVARVEAILRERLDGRAPSRIQFMRWRLGRVDPQRTDMVRILWAVRHAVGNPSIRMDELFDLDPAHSANWMD